MSIIVARRGMEGFFFGQILSTLGKLNCKICIAVHKQFISRECHTNVLVEKICIEIFFYVHNIQPKLKEMLTKIWMVTFTVTYSKKTIELLAL